MKPEKLIKGISHIKVQAVRGKDGKDAVPPSKDELVSLMKPLIPTPVKGEKGERGETGERGIPGESIKGDKGDRGEKGDSIKGDKGDQGDAGSPDTSDQVIDKVNAATKKIDSKQVKGLLSVIETVDNLARTSVGGGGRTVRYLDDGVETSAYVTELNFTTGLTLAYGGDGRVTIAAAGGHTIEDEGTPLTARTKLNFVGAGVTITDDAGDDATVVTINSGGTPGGSDTQIQFNDGGSFGGDADFTWDKTANLLSVTGNVYVSGEVITSLLTNTDSTNLPYIDIGNGISAGFDANSSGQAGADVTFNSQNGGANQNGGSTNFYGGNSSSGNGNGGDINFRAGAKSGSGTDGKFTFNPKSAGILGILNFDNIATTDKTFIFPNTTGTIALTDNPTDITVPDEAYGAGWNGSLEVPTKNALYDKIETLGAGSGITRTVTVTSGNYTAGSTTSVDYVYFIAGAHTSSLPAASGNTNRYTFKNNHSANVTIDTLGAENVEGAASISIAPEESVGIISDGTNWFVV